MYLDITENELQEIYEAIMVILGGIDIDVDLTKEEVLIMLRRANMEFQKETSIWQLQNQFANVYGLPAGLIQQNQIATMNFSLVNQITDWFASMSRTGGKIPWHKDYIQLEAGRQIYDLSKESSKPYPPGTRRIHRVMWVQKPETMNFTRFSATNPSGDDILYSANWNFTTNGLNYGSSPLAFLGYSMDTIMLMQSAENRSKILFSEFFHNLSGDILEITPQPGVNVQSFPPGMKLFYYYWDESEVALNGPNPAIDLGGNTSSTIEGYYTGMPPGQSNLIANPINMKIDYVDYSTLSPWAKTWIFDYTLARCKYIQGSKWRKIQKTIGTGEMEYTIEFDYQSLLQESQYEIQQLIEQLRTDMQSLNLALLMQQKRDMVEAATKIAQKVPRLWKIG